MLTKATSKPECESAMKAELVENPENFENTEINPSKEFFSLCKLSYTFSREGKTFDKKQARTLETKMHKLYYKVLNSGNAEIDNIVTLAQMYYNVSEVYVESNGKEKQQIATNSILRSLNLIKDKELNRKTILLALDVYNLLGYIYHKQKKTEKAIQAFDKVVELYLMYIKGKDKYGTPLDLENIFFKSLEKLNSYVKLAKTYLAVLRTLVRMHSTIGTMNKFIICSHMLLAAEFNKSLTVEEYINWMKTAMLLSDLFLMSRRFTEARNHLIVASFVKRHFIDVKYYNICQKLELSLEEPVSREQHIIASTLVAVHWVKYGIALLDTSATQLQLLEKNPTYERSSLESKYPTKSQKHAPQKLLLLTEIQEEFSITDEYAPFKDKYLSDYNAAKEVFLYVIKILSDMTAHYCLSKDMKLCATIALCTSNAYKYMACYEQDLTSQDILQSRRRDILLEAINIIFSNNNNSNDNNNNNRNELRHLRLQLAIAYSSLINIKLENLETINVQNTEQRYNIIIDEINDLVKAGLVNLQIYMCHE
ncbi:uncharacterized protein LOC116840312 [Odontomachus brunneus]|uniref:uncharacterized protein LOC116840312 n=1 Tax=Odontomachus brunneus TaxID=486640 RepID=UPI0013F19A04|nr:uncharacterized protein LOC116840312 [Odontomachus brunneus]XP_032662765.1 uncharacterized protein LOC116840312 [Odontomachus brunneus]